MAVHPIRALKEWFQASAEPGRRATSGTEKQPAEETKGQKAEKPLERDTMAPHPEAEQKPPGNAGQAK